MIMSKPSESSIHSGEIWLVIDSLKFGGIETHVRELASGLVKFGQPVRVVFLQRYAQPQFLTEALSALGLSWSFLSDLQTQQGLLSQLYSAVKKYRPVLLHAHGYKASLCTRVVKLLSGVAQFSTYHAGETPTGRVWLYDWLDRYSAFVSNQAICVSDAIAHKLPVNSLVMNNFIAQPKANDSNAKQIAFIGRLSEEKAPDRFVKLAQHFSELPFHLYGDGPLREPLSQNAPSNLTFHGHVADMDEHWQDIALVVIPSRFEGLPMVSLEAMGRGIPVIAAKVGALPTLITHGANGWISDSDLALRECLEQWLCLPAQQRQLIGQRARQTVNQSYTDQAVIPQLLALYRLKSGYHKSRARSSNRH